MMMMMMMTTTGEQQMSLVLMFRAILTFTQTHTLIQRVTDDVMHEMWMDF